MGGVWAGEGLDGPRFFHVCFRSPSGLHVFSPRFRTPFFHVFFTFFSRLFHVFFTFCGAHMVTFSHVFFFTFFSRFLGANTVTFFLRFTV